MLLVTLAAHSTLSLLTYWFLEQGDDFTMELEVYPLSIQKTNFRLKQIHKILNACCKAYPKFSFMTLMRVIMRPLRLVCFFSGKWTSYITPFKIS